MRFLSVLFIFVFTVSVKAQKVKVLELGIGFPIENVTIYNDTQETIIYTDKKGIADLSDFKDSDVISFNHISFYFHCWSKFVIFNTPWFLHYNYFLNSFI